ncbi:MAG TPA: nucleotide disphospho-sugar-binding domain-containing protein [Aldersonia sp.]
MFAPGIPIANAHRTQLGLPAIEKLGDIHDACAHAIVAVPKEFEPDAQDAANVLRIGPVLDAPPLSRQIDKVEVPDGSTPMVVVSLSTSAQGGQVDLLQRCVDAVARLPVRAIVTTGASIDPASVNAGANTRVVRYVPHSAILPSASLVITHAGLGTTMAELGRGVPLLCTPMGRDQFFNAEQVQALGAGRMLRPDSSSDAIARPRRTSSITTTSRPARSGWPSRSAATAARRRPLPRSKRSRRREGSRRSGSVVV